MGTGHPDSWDIFIFPHHTALCPLLNTNIFCVVPDVQRADQHPKNTWFSPQCSPMFFPSSRPSTLSLLYSCVIPWVMGLQDPFKQATWASLLASWSQGPLSASSPFIEQKTRVQSLPTFWWVDGRGRSAASWVGAHFWLTPLCLWLNHSWPLPTAGSLSGRGSNTLFSAWALRSHWCKLIGTFLLGGARILLQFCLHAHSSLSVKWFVSKGPVHFSFQFNNDTKLIDFLFLAVLAKNKIIITIGQWIGQPWIEAKFKVNQCFGRKFEAWELHLFLLYILLFVFVWAPYPKVLGAYPWQGLGYLVCCWGSSEGQLCVWQEPSYLFCLFSPTIYFNTNPDEH